MRPGQSVTSVSVNHTDSPAGFGMAKQGIYESASGSFALGTSDMQDIQNVEVFWL